MGLSAFTGGIYHGNEELGEGLRFLSWSFLSAALLFALFGAYKGVGNKMLRIFFLTKSAVLLSISIYQANFTFMAIDTAISLMGFVVIGNFLFLRNQSRWILLGIMISLFSALVFANQIVLHEEYMTANDIGHYISIPSLFFMMIGVREDAKNERLAVVLKQAA
jgi:uncharacterized membrane protein YhhN